MWMMWKSLPIAMGDPLLRSRDGRSLPCTNLTSDFSFIVSKTLEQYIPFRAPRPSHPAPDPGHPAPDPGHPAPDPGRPVSCDPSLLVYTWTTTESFSSNDEARMIELCTEGLHGNAGHQLGNAVYRR